MSEFDDPFKPSDATVIRPRPGAGRRSPSEAPPPPARPVAAPQSEPLSAGALDAVGFGLGPLVRAASPLLLLAGQLRGTLTGPDVSTLRRHAMEEIRRFEDRARAAGVQNETVQAARYAICAAVDEAVMATPWGAQSEWTQQSLLVALHREAYGGEKFFDMLQRVSSDPKHHIDLMEVLYLCLAMGFGGKYHVARGGEAQLESIRHDLYRRIREYRGAEHPELSPRWQGIQDRRNPLMKYVPWWVVGAGVTAIVLLVFMLYKSWLNPGTEDIRQTLAGLRTVEAPAQVQRGLDSYLTPQINDRLLTVEGGTKVVIPELFASNSDQLKDDGARTTIQAVCRALDNFPSYRIQVVGHTDDAPPRARFSGNQELSEKAELRNCLQTNKYRTSAIGRGATQLLKDRPRAASRRVEIMMVDGR